MSVDLLALLSGERPQDAERPNPGDVVTRLRCPCGSVVALLARSGGESWLWRASYRHTARGAAGIVTDAALTDFEDLATLGDADALTVVALFADRVDYLDALAEVLPPLRMPARLRKVTGVASWLAAQSADRPPELAPERLAQMEAGCGKCRRVLDVGPTVVELEPAASPARTVIVEDPPWMGVRKMAYGWPDSARPSRVALYKALCGVLY